MLSLHAVILHTHTYTHSHADGVLQYNVELYENQIVRYSGPCILEVRDGEITVWNRDTWEEVVSWNLAHIRSFKAKKHMLSIYPGRYACTVHTSHDTVTY